MIHVGARVRWKSPSPNHRQIVTWFGTVLGLDYQVPDGYVAARHTRSGWREGARVAAAHVIPEYPQHGLSGPEPGARPQLIPVGELELATSTWPAASTIAEVDALIEMFRGIPSNANGGVLAPVIVGGDWSDEALDLVMADAVRLQRSSDLAVARCIRAVHPHDRMQLQAARPALERHEAAVRAYAAALPAGRLWDVAFDSIGLANLSTGDGVEAMLRACDALGEERCRAVFCAARGG